MEISYLCSMEAEKENGCNVRRDNAIENNQRKTVEVVAAIMVHDGTVLATQRGYGKWKGYWEFPGGKIEAGESREEALRRELREELEAEVEALRLFETVEYDYPDFHLTMHCYLCRLKGDSYRLKEHLSARWLRPEAFGEVLWLPADAGLLQRLAAEKDMLY